jgi:triacylglycerol lipase
MARETSLAPARPTIVFLHGLGRTHRSMHGLRRYVEALGYRTWARTYPSRRGRIEELAAEVAGQIRRDVGERPIVGVTHSMGGILVRYMRDLLPWEGVVMLAPPNQGSRVAASLVRSRVYRWVYGPAGRALGDASGWPAPPQPFAVIAGTRGPTVGNLPSWLIARLRLIPPGELHDGTVLVAETRMDGMAAFAEVPASHTFLMNHPATRSLVARFLAERRF